MVSFRLHQNCADRRSAFNVALDVRRERMSQSAAEPIGSFRELVCVFRRMTDARRGMECRARHRAINARD